MNFLFEFFEPVSNHAKAPVEAAQYMGQGMAVTSDPMGRRPLTVQYPFE